MENLEVTMDGSEVWRRQRVLVTGCTGLLGAWLTEWLVRHGADVVGLVRDHVPRSNLYRMGLAQQMAIVQGSVEDYDLVERTVNEYEIAVMFHLAAQTIAGIANANPRSTFATNIAGTWNVLEACRRSRWTRAVVLASSDKAYGDQAELPYRERTPLQGRHPYDVSKSCADLLGQAYWASYELPVAITRCGNFYGGGDLNFNRIVPGTIRSLLDGQRPIIRSDGTLVRDYVYIKDAVRAYVQLAQKVLEGKARGEVYNFGNGLPMTVREVVERISRCMGKEELQPVMLNDAPNEILRQYLSPEKARRELGWQAHYTFEAGLQETIQWYRDFFQDTKLTACVEGEALQVD